MFEGEYIDNEIIAETQYDKNGKIIYQYNNSNRIRKIFDSVVLIYEGEYLNSKRNGKGKEYYSNGEIKFEGEYLNGKKWNGKGYDTLKNIIYELKNGKGEIKLFNNENKLIYEGGYSNGLANGKGKEYYNNEVIFEGEFLDGKKWNGIGKDFDYNDEVIFEGEYLNGKKWNGKGKESIKNEYEEIESSDCYNDD